MASTIGGIKVDLGINTGQFTSGLKKATGAMSKFGIQTTLSLETVGKKIGQMIGALPRAVRASIDHADALSKSAQKAGTTVEALSRLEYAAKLSDVSLEGLTGGLQKLSKGMAEAAGGKGPAAAFKALGIAVTDASGNLRDGDAVLSDIADRFSRFEDGATKTALALQIFGKSGAELIPLLNEGADGLKRWADESDRTGNTISTKTAKAAEQFNDTLTRLSEIMRGVINQMMEAVLPTLQGLADLLMQVDPQALAVGTSIAAITVAATLAAPAIGTLVGALGGLYSALALIAALPAGVLALAGIGVAASTSPVGAGEDALIRELGLTKLPDGTLNKSIDFASMFSPVSGKSTFGSTGDMWKALKPLVIPPFNTGDAVKSLEPLDLGIEATTEKVGTLADAIGGPLTNAITGFVDAIMSGENPLQAFANSLADIGKSLLNQGIQGLVSSLLGGISFGGPSLAGWGGGAGYMDFDGGGFTGYGPRSGGMDGKGGRLAMVHPNETILDHTKGQSGGGLTMNFNITGSAQDAAAIANLVRTEARSMYKQLQRNPDR